MKYKVLSVVLILLVVTSAYALYVEEHARKPINDMVRIDRGVYGDWVQEIDTNAGRIRIIFNPIYETWIPKSKDGYIPIVYNIPDLVNGAFEVRVDLKDSMDNVELETHLGKIALVFTNEITIWESTQHDGNWGAYMRLICDEPLQPLRMYQIPKPKILEKYYRKSISYGDVEIDISKETFLSAAADKGEDGIVDSTQVIGIFKEYWEQRERLSSPKSPTNPFGYDDTNNDTIVDFYQTHGQYMARKEGTFIDVDGDGLCDNYQPGVYNKAEKKAIYKDLTLDLTKDVFQSKEWGARKGWVNYVDQDYDGINDYYQDSPYFRYIDKERSFVGTGKTVGFSDANGDTINDAYQTLEYYRLTEMTNFMDLDGDGLCDNYKR